MCERNSQRGADSRQQSSQQFDDDIIYMEVVGGTNSNLANIFGLGSLHFNLKEKLIMKMT
jgi:hypothetical protein